MPYSKKENRKTNKQLDKIAKKEKLDVAITHPYDVSSIKDEKRLKKPGEKQK